MKREQFLHDASPASNDSPTLEEDLGVWLLDYNYRRVHGSRGKTPMQRWAEVNEQTPL